MLCCDQGFADGLALGCSGKGWSSCVCNASISLVQAEPSKAKLFYHSNLAADDYANCESPRDGLCRRPCPPWPALLQHSAVPIVV